MTTAASDFDYDVRFPQFLLDQLGRGEVTASMVLAMLCLRRWADWKTGMVKHASAGGLSKVTAKAYSVRTFQAAMLRLEKMGWITRHIIPGSRQDFAVTLHNYKWIDEDGKVHILNPKPLTVAVERVRQARANKATSVDSGTDRCGRTPVQPEDTTALRTAVEFTFKGSGELHEKTGTSQGKGLDACGRNCTEASDKVLSDPNLNSCSPSSDPEAVPNAYEEHPVASRRTPTASLRSVEPTPNTTAEPELLPENFQPDDSNVRYAKKQGLDLEGERTLFVELHGAVGNQRENWQKVFRKWLIDAAPLHGHIVPPEWMPVKEWNEYLVMRERDGKRLTKAAQEIAVRILGDLRDKGYSVAGVLGQCTGNNRMDLARAVRGMTTGSLTANVREHIAAQK